MIKKNLWIVALLAVTAFLFMGCPDNNGDLKNPPKVVEATDDLVITDAAEIGALLTAEGFYGADTGGCSVDGNVMVFSNVTNPDNVGFRLDFPEDAVGFLNLEVTFKLIEASVIAAPGFPKIGFKSAKGSGDVTPYDEHERVWNPATIGSEQTQNFSLSSPNKLPNNLVYISHNQHGSGATAGAKPPVSYKLEITKIKFVAGEPVPCCEGDCDVTTCKDCVEKACSGACGTTCCLNFNGGNDTKIEIVAGKLVHTNPPVVAASGGAKINANGTVTMNNYSVLFYKFPADTATYKLADYDYIDITYTLSGLKNTVNASNVALVGENFKVHIRDYKGTDAYTQAGGGYNDFGKVLDPVGTATYQLQTWGDNGTGGFAIRMNSYDVSTTNVDGCAEFIDIKINKIEFSKGTRHTVEFFSPMTPNNNNLGKIQVLSGNGIGTRGPTPSNPGWTFIGWRDSWDPIDNVADGNKFTAATAIAKDVKLFAEWLFLPLPNVSAEATANGTLFTSKEFAPTFTLGGKTYYVMSVANVTFADLADADFATDDAATITAFKTIAASGTATSRISYDVRTLSPYVTNYGRVKITYDLIPITAVSGSRAVALRNTEGASGGSDVTSGSWGNDGAAGNATPWLEEGTGKVVSVNAADLTNGFFGIAKSSAGAMLFRITKIEMSL